MAHTIASATAASRVVRRHGALLSASAVVSMAIALVSPALAQDAVATTPAPGAGTGVARAAAPAVDTAAPSQLTAPTSNPSDTIRAGASAGGAAESSYIVVTATRLRASGFTAPTPTTMLGGAEIAKNAEPNIFNTIVQLPSLQGSTGASVGTNGTSGGTNGLSSFNLRGLGTIRVLTLLDGQRVVPANVTGVPDVSEFPQLLVERVDVVTGGASASYGSDAVAGVVNFITQKKFNGFKANILAGETTYKDDKNYTIQAAAGRGFLDDRLHAEVSVEYSHEGGVAPNGFGTDEGPNGRNWYKAPGLQVRTIANTAAGTPQITRILNAQDYQFAKYGLITSGPLQGTAFGANGVPFQFVYGSNGVPSKAASGAVTNCISPFCVGGDTSGNVGNGTSLASKLTRKDAYGRVSYDFGSRSEIYATVNLAEVTSSNTPNPGAFKNANLTIQCANPFVPASVQAQCLTAGITSFQFGTSNAEIPQFISVNPKRTQYRYVVGADGAFDAFGENWTYSTYYQHGLNKTHIHVDNITLTPRYNAAINAVASPGGTVICGNAAATGCAPLNVIGNVPISAAALAYIEPAHGPYQRSHQTEDAFSASLNGEPITLPAGPIAFATGVEYRREAYRVRGDPYGNGAAADDPYTADYPADPVLNTAGNNWYAGNFHNGSGKYHVIEGFLELGVPIFKSAGLGDLDLNVAGRATHYSTSGFVATWKVGGTWKTPIDGLRIRAVTSKDVRAPNLSELFAAPIVSNGTVNNDFTGQTVTILNQAIGNPNLKPEIGRTTEAGVVLSRPTWARGFSASVDYYRIKVKNVISSLTAQQEEDLCFAGNQALCSQILLTSAVPNTNFVIVQSFNLASIFTDGFDIETSYQTKLAAVGLPGSVVLRALATHTMNFTTDPGLPGSIPLRSAGNNSGSTPYWKILGVESWDTEKFSLTFTERWFSDGVINREYIECTSNCPLPTSNHPTIDNNKMKGSFYLDVGGSYNLTDKLKVYFKIDNVTNKDPAPLYQAVPNNLGANPSLYDTLGRMYHVGLRYNF